MACYPLAKSFKHLEIVDTASDYIQTLMMKF